jgi:site-specific recombinase XerD
MPNWTQDSPPALSEAVPPFLDYARAELQFRPQSISKYRDSLRHVGAILGDRPVTGYSKADVTAVKAHLLARGLSVSRQVSFLSALKRLLTFCRDEHGLAVMDPEAIAMPRRPRREVAYLTADEVDRFAGSIRTATLEGRTSVAGLRFRALVEVLLGSAMRIGEALSLQRSDVDFAAREARVVGKGDKQRVAFFTERALSWLRRYLDTRTDDNPALFARQDGRGPLRQPDIWRPFTRYRRLSGINKRITPHLLRHTAATQLLFNGCPIGHIKEILGHERLETTCRYYLGLDHSAAQRAHEQFLVYANSAHADGEDADGTAASTGGSSWR